MFDNGLKKDSIYSHTQQLEINELKNCAPLFQSLWSNPVSFTEIMWSQIKFCLKNAKHFIPNSWKNTFVVDCYSIWGQNLCIRNIALISAGYKGNMLMTVYQISLKQMSNENDII